MKMGVLLTKSACGFKNFHAHFAHNIIMEPSFQNPVSTTAFTFHTCVLQNNLAAAESTNSTEPTQRQSGQKRTLDDTVRDVQTTVVYHVQCVHVQSD